MHHHLQPTGFDPAPAIAALDVPALWLYGEADALVPTHESMQVLGRLKKRHDFMWQLVPAAGHELFRVARDNEAERLRSPGMSPVVLDALRAWLEAHAGAADGRR